MTWTQKCEEKRFYYTVLWKWNPKREEYDIKAKWGKMIEDYLHQSKEIRCVFLLIDIRHEPSNNDKIMYQWILDHGYEPVIIATKLDKIKRSQIQKQLKIIRQGLQVMPGTILIPFSAETKQGREEIWDLIDELTGMKEDNCVENVKNVEN